MALEDVRKLGDRDTVPFKTATAAGSSFVMGGITGAVVATWRDVPAVERNVAMPALIKTGRMMSSYGALFCGRGRHICARRWYCGSDARQEGHLERGHGRGRRGLRRGHKG